MTPGSKRIRIITFLYVIFISWIVYTATTDYRHLLFKLVALIPYGDKIAHVILIGILAYLLNLSFPTKLMQLGKSSITRLTFFLLLFVTLEEISQNFFVNRTADIFDWLGNILGIVFAQILHSRRPAK